jgi:hypothetical protein
LDLGAAGAHRNAEAFLEIPQMFIPRAEELLEVAFTDGQALHLRDAPDSDSNPPNLAFRDGPHMTTEGLFVIHEIL